MYRNSPSTPPAPIRSTAQACAISVRHTLAARALFVLALATALLLSVRPAGAADLGFRGLGFQAGATSASNWDNGYQVTVHADFGTLTHGLYLQPSVSYRAASGSDNFLGLQIDRDLSVLALGADLLWYPARERRGWYVGGGAYVNRIDFKVLGISQETDELGASAIGGYDFPLGDLTGFAEARYHLVSGYNTLQLGVGVRFGG
ncbi:MAG: hypothetical protein QM311_07110 [Acidobacteriota bacterium]|jgi:hypothetical protein|nr:hypothetical protein [Acidobacteriota bacterium]